MTASKQAFSVFIFWEDMIRCNNKHGPREKTALTIAPSGLANDKQILFQWRLTKNLEGI